MAIYHKKQGLRWVLVTKKITAVILIHLFTGFRTSLSDLKKLFQEKSYGAPKFYFSRQFYYFTRRRPSFYALGLKFFVLTDKEHQVFNRTFVLCWTQYICFFTIFGLIPIFVWLFFSFFANTTDFKTAVEIIRTYELL